MSERAIEAAAPSFKSVVEDMLAGLAYLRSTDSVPYGFGIDRLEQTGRAALAAAQRVAGEDDRLREAAKTAINCLRWLDRAGGLGIDRHDNIRQVADRLEAALALSRGKVWRCFNCDQVFTDAAEASAHFGNFKGDVPTCRMSNYDVCALRMSRDAFAKRAEDSDRDADALKAENFRLTTERNEARFAVQFLIDHIEYNDSYGVEGSSFMCCHLCSGGGAPGVTLKHDPSCAVARYEQVAQEWEEERKSEFADAQAAGVSPGKVEGWRTDCENAPRDGTHILVAWGPYDQHWTFSQRPPSVVHYWSNPGEEGFYLSNGARDDDEPLKFSLWKSLSEAPGCD